MNRRGLAFAAAILLSGCATVGNSYKLDIADPDLRAAWEIHSQKVQQISGWNLSGRFGASTETDAWSGSLSWDQNNGHYTIRLVGPLNQGALELSGEQNYATLRLSERDIFVDSSAESLLHQHTGMQFPINGLRYWILGLPSPKARKHNVVIDENGHLAKLEEDHWRVDFRRYRDFDGTSLPTKIFLQHDHVEVRLVLDHWEYRS